MADVISLGQARAKRSDLAQDWSVLDMLQEAVRDVESGEMPATSALLIFVHGGEVCDIDVYSAKLDTLQGIGACHLAQETLSQG